MNGNSLDDAGVGFEEQVQIGTMCLEVCQKIRWAIVAAAAMTANEHPGIFVIDIGAVFSAWRPNRRHSLSADWVRRKIGIGSRLANVVSGDSVWTVVSRLRVGTNAKPFDSTVAIILAAAGQIDGSSKILFFGAGPAIPTVSVVAISLSHKNLRSNYVPHFYKEVIVS
jgi:hypothetical protein